MDRFNDKKKCNSLSKRYFAFAKWEKCANVVNYYILPYTLESDKNVYRVFEEYILHSM